MLRLIDVIDTTEDILSQVHKISFNESITNDDQFVSSFLVKYQWILDGGVSTVVNVDGRDCLICKVRLAPQILEFLIRLGSIGPAAESATKPTSSRRNSIR